MHPGQDSTLLREAYKAASKMLTLIKMKKHESWSVLATYQKQKAYNKQLASTLQKYQGELIQAEQVVQVFVDSSVALPSEVKKQLCAPLS